MRDERSARYCLRKTLPPWKAEETIEELVTYGPRYGIDEVIFKIDTEGFSHGLPTVEMIKPFIPWLNLARERLGEVGIAMSINPWVTLVHCDRGRDCRGAHPRVDWMVGHDGAQCKACACPLSSGWRELMADLYAMYASTRPRVLWLEDDIRTFNHEPARYGCFCELHLAEFERRTGERRTREELVGNILSPGEPHPDRARWFDLLGETMVDTARVFEQAVHAVSPETHLGLMTSGPKDHAMEGRRWKAFCEALAGPVTLVARPCMGNYQESNARGLYYADEMVRRTGACLPADTEIQTEMESFPMTLYSKSCAFTRLQNGLTFVLGAEGSAMNMYDHCGSPMENWPQYGRMLAETKPFMNGIASRCLPGARERGVGLLHHRRGADAMRLAPGSDYEELRQKDQGWMVALEALGMSVTFQDSPVRAVTGQILRAYTKEEVEGFLKEGLLLDSSAAATVMEMGLGEKIGVAGLAPFNKLSRALGAEEYVDGAFGGPGTYSTLINLTRREDLAEFALVPGARAVSMYVDPDRERVMPGMVLFENDVGGRAAVYAADLSDEATPAFLNEHRQRQLWGVVRWLGRGAMPLAVEGGVYPWATRRDYGEYTIVAVANLTLDAWPRLTMTLSTDGRAFERIEALEGDGTWRTCEAAKREEGEGHVKLTFDRPIEPTGLAVYTLWS